MKKTDKVICVNAKQLAPNSHLIKGEVYTIKDIVTNPYGEKVVLLWETVNGETYGYPYFYGYRPERFAKINEREVAELVKEVCEQTLNEPVLN